MTSPRRRDFLKGIGLAAAAVLTGRSFGSQPADNKPLGRVQRRNFGRHKFTVSSLALGGYSLRTANDDDARRIVDAALNAGIDFFDNAWDYHNGTAEELMGRCIKGKRDRVFLMTKVCTHDNGGRREAIRMLDQSLARLGTDHLDLWQVHAVSTLAQVRNAFAPGGVIEALDEARKAGKVRFVGFTGHTDPDVHLAMLSHGYPFDACQLPISAIEANSNAFVRRVLPELVRQGIAPLAMKSLCGSAKPVREGIYSVREGISYALSQPVTTVVSGITNLQELTENAAIATDFSQMSSAELASLEDRCRAATESENFQPYRKWMSYKEGDAAKFDRTA